MVLGVHDHRGALRADDEVVDVGAGVADLDRVDSPPAWVGRDELGELRADLELASEPYASIALRRAHAEDPRDEVAHWCLPPPGASELAD